MGRKRRTAGTGRAAIWEPRLPELMFVIAVFGLIGWGLFSAGAWAVNGFNREVGEADRMIAANEARTGTANRGGPSDALVMAGAMTAIKNLAVDPGSVQFQHVGVHRQPSGTKAVCGEFNAKNRAGGFNGFERFISAGTAERTWIERDVADFQSVWSSLCH